MGQSPVAITVAFVPTSSHSSSLLGATLEGNTTLASCWGSLPFWGAEQIRDTALLDAGRMWRETEADAGSFSRNELVFCPLLPAALNPMDRSLELCQKALSCIHLQEGPFHFPRCFLLCRG